MAATSKKAPPKSPSENSTGAQATVASEDQDAKRFLIRPYFGYSDLSLSLTPDKGHDVDFDPNAPFFVGVRLGYRGYQVSASVDAGPADNENKYGKSAAYDIGIARAWKPWGRELLVSGYLHHVAGFYAKAAVPEIRPDITMAVLGASAIFFFNPNYSYEAALLQYVPRSRSSGSWALKTSLGVLDWGSNKHLPMLPSTAQPDFGSVSQLVGSEAAYLEVAGGYAYDWLIGHGLFLDVAVIAGFTIAGQKLEDSPNHYRKGPSASPSVMVSAAVGYVGKVFHGGLYTSVDGQGTSVGSAEALLLRTNVLMFAGVRF